MVRLCVRLYSIIYSRPPGSRGNYILAVVSNKTPDENISSYLIVAYRHVKLTKYKDTSDFSSACFFYYFLFK